MGHFRRPGEVCYLTGVDAEVDTAGPVPRDPDGRSCVNCGYDLRGLVRPRCPECGLTFDADQPAPPRIPWLYRSVIGRANAYLRTIYLVTFRPRRFADEFRRDYRRNPADAKSFAGINLAAAPLAAAAALALDLAPAGLWEWSNADFWIQVACRLGLVGWLWGWLRLLAGSSPLAVDLLDDSPDRRARSALNG